MLFACAWASGAALWLYVLCANGLADFVWMWLVWTTLAYMVIVAEL